MTIKFLLICLSLLFLSACNSSRYTRSANSSTPTRGNVTYSIKEVPVVYTTISEISDRADIVIIGNPVETREVVNTARIPGDPVKPDPDHYSIGQIYEVLVDEYVKPIH